MATTHLRRVRLARASWRSPATTMALYLAQYYGCRIHARLPFAEAARAHTMLEGGEVIVKLVMKP
jgi:NADPH2:quinone reductase